MGFNWGRVHKHEEQIENDIFERVSEQVCSYYEVENIEDLTEEQISEVQQWALDDLGSSSVIQIGITDLIPFPFGSFFQVFSPVA